MKLCSAPLWIHPKPFGLSNNSVYILRGLGFTLPNKIIFLDSVLREKETIPSPPILFIEKTLKLDSPEANQMDLRTLNAIASGSSWASPSLAMNE